MMFSIANIGNLLGSAERGLFIKLFAGQAYAHIIN